MNKSGITFLELILTIGLVSIIAGSVGVFFFWEIRMYTSIYDQQSAMTKLSDTFLLMQNVLHTPTSGDLSGNSSQTKISAGAKVLFEYQSTPKTLYWEGSPILENVLATFSYSSGDTTPDWKESPQVAGWDAQLKTGSVRIQLQMMDFNSDQIAFVIHPRGS